MEFLAIIDKSTLTAILVFILTFLVVYYSTQRRAGVPPGPPLIPVIGNLPSLASKDLFGQLEKLRHRYGDIFALYIGSELTIFLNGYDVIHEALIKKGSMFVRRPESNFFKLVIKEPIIIFANDSMWKEQRMFAQKALQELCFQRGGQYIENIINTEGSELVNIIDQLTEPFDIDEYTTVTVTNVISQVLFRHRFQHGDKEFLKIMKLINESGRSFLRLHLLANCFPVLFRLPIDVVGYEKFNEKVYVNVLESLKLYMDLYKDNHDSLLGMYRTRIEEAEEKDDKDTLFTQFNMLKMCYEMIAAGSESTSTTLNWMLLYLVRNPHTQDTMFREINRELGTKNLPSLGDKPRLPYVHATTLEVLRIANVSPLAVPHSPSRDLIFRGHLFPQDCTVMINLNSALKDPMVWKDPETFKPERFLNEDQTEVVIPKEFFPFSLGPRSCIGETLARSELFLFTTILLQNFKFYPEIEGKIPSIDGSFGQTWNPNPYKLVAKRRI